MKSIAWILGLFLIAGGARAQTATGFECRTAVTSWEALRPLTRSAQLAFFPCPLADDVFGGRLLLSREPYPITRGTLDDEGGALHRYHDLPGGIVLGLKACVPAELQGARIAFDDAGALGLRLDDRAGGIFVRAPAFSPAKVRACARFVRDGLDGLIDIFSEDGSAPRIAPAFAGSELVELLVRMDQVPHRVVPETLPWKTMIVDSQTRVGARAGELVLGADLEVRCYDEGDGTGWTRCVRALEASGPDFVGPLTRPDLSSQLSPLAELAAWLAFLRWARSADPSGFAVLCEE